MRIENPSSVWLVLCLTLVCGCNLFTELGDSEVLDSDMSTLDMGSDVESMDMDSTVADVGLPDWIPPGPVLFVATDGDDGNDGSYDSPWATFAHATAQLSADDTLFIRGGTYSESLAPQADGLPGRPIFIRSFYDEEVIIADVDICLDVTDRKNINLFGLSLERPGVRWGIVDSSLNIVLEEIKAIGSADPTSTTVAEHEGMLILDSVSVEVFNSDFRGWHLLYSEGDSGGHSFALRRASQTIIRDSIFEGGTVTAIELVGGRNNIILNNQITNPGDGCVNIISSTELFFIENEVHGCGSESANYDVGVEINNSTSITVRGNLIYDTSRGILQEASAEGHVMRGGRIAHNTIILNQREGIAIDDESNLNVEVVDMVVVNNILYGNSNGDPLSGVQLLAHDFEPVSMDVFPIDLYIRGNGFSNLLVDDCAAQTSETMRLENSCPITIEGLANGDVDYFQTLASVGNRYVMDNIEGDPSLASMTLPSIDPTLQEGSSYVDRGLPLTFVFGAGSVGVQVSVADSRYFHGPFGSSVPGERIMIDGQVAEIIGIDRATNTLALDTAVTVEDGSPVTLEYLGEGPDIGSTESH